LQPEEGKIPRARVISARPKTVSCKTATYTRDVKLAGFRLEPESNKQMEYRDGAIAEWVEEEDCLQLAISEVLDLTLATGEVLAAL
jgi:hypothetical protein